jgi:hypothetical protein
MMKTLKVFRVNVWKKERNNRREKRRKFHVSKKYKILLKNEHGKWGQFLQKI